MIDLTQTITNAQIATALLVIAFAVVFLASRRQSQK